MALAVAMAGHGRRLRGVATRAKDAETDLLMKAGLRNLLGVEENKMAQKLQEACMVSEDMQRCLSDMEVKQKLTMEELTGARAKSIDLEAEMALLAKDLKATKAQLAEAEASRTTAAAEAAAALADEKAKTKTLQAELAEAQAAAKSAESEYEAKLQSVQSELAAAVAGAEEHAAAGEGLSREIKRLEVALAEAQARAESGPAKGKGTGKGKGKGKEP